MKTIPYIKTLLLCFLLVFCQSCNKSNDFYILDGKGQNLSDYKGQWLLINFWAEWCAPCREEIPELNILLNQTKMDNLSIIGVSFDPLSNDELRHVIKRLDIEFPVMATEPMPVLPFSLPRSLPSNYLYNPNGELVLKFSGTQTVESLTKLLKKQEIKFNLTQ